MKRLQYIALYLLIALCALPGLVSAQQQGLPVDGKDFYIGFVNPTFNNNPPQLADGDFRIFFGMYVLVSSYTDNQVNISYFDDAGNETPAGTYHIFAQQGQAILLTKNRMQMTDTLGDKPEYKACHITAKRPINVQYFSTGACAGGSYLSIPTPALGKHYVIPSWNDNPGVGSGQPYQAENAGGFFLIMAAFNNTTVTITPNGKTAGGHTGVSSGSGANGTRYPYSTTLQRGQCYWVKGDGSDIDNDLTGSTVVSDKPIGVLAGHEDAYIGEAPNALSLDGRDFMVEQVIPAEYWDSTGYVSIPLVGAKPVDESRTGYGQIYRVFTNDTLGAKVDENDCNRAHNDMSTGLYRYPAVERDGVGCPIEFHSNDGHKFGVMCYEQRDQGSAEPYPAESMMSIVPMSRWRTSYLFFVPSNTFETLQDYYINVIGEPNDVNNNIVYSHNGGNLAKLSTIGTSQGAFTQIPNHPELKGVRYTVHPGSYYITNPRTKYDPSVPNDADTILHGSFMVYHYGMRALDPDFDLGDFCGDDFFFAYALPIGMTVSSGPGNPVVTVDTLCSGWHVCVHDFIPLTSATLIDDPNGDVYGRPGKVYKNVNFDEISDPDNTGEIVFNGNDTSVCFDINVSNPFDSAYAPLYIVDKNGYHLSPILELHYKAPSVKELLQVPQPPKSPTYLKIDTLQYGTIRVGPSNQVCSTLVFINTAAKGSNPFHIDSAFMKKKGANFILSSTIPPLPVSLNGGDTLQVIVCFNASDTVAYEDSVIIATDCFKAPLPTTGKGGTPLIYATDYDFGDVTVGTQSCADITIFNRGTLPFTVTKNWVLHNTTSFSMNAASIAKLPHVIQPGASFKLTFCYTPLALGPEDSTTVDWNTDIDQPFTDQIKSWSFLKGHPIKPGLKWDRPTQLDSVICEDSLIRRVNLLNNGSATATNCVVFFNGPDAAEYSVVGDRLGKIPLQGFRMDPNDTVWVDVRFKADLTKGYAPRHANLLATSYNDATQSNDTTLIAFTGLVQHAQLAISPSLLDLGFITKGQAEGGNIIIKDTGNAPFVIKSTTFPNPPITSITRNGKQLSPGDTIYPGEIDTLHILAQLDTYVDTTVTYTLFSDHACGDYTDTLRVATSNLSVLATGYPAPDVFVGCREHDSTVTFFNKGTVAIMLDSVDLSGVTPPGQFDLVDSKGNKGQSITIGKKLFGSQSEVIGIVYHPTVAGPASGTIRFVYDSAGVKKVITTNATGNGVTLRTTLSAAQASGQPYTADVGGSFDVPVTLAAPVLPKEAGAYRVKFTLTYRRDVVNLVGTPAVNTAAGYNYTPGTTPTTRTIAGGNEAIDFDVSRNAPISNLDEIVRPTYQVMVAIEMITPFVISNGEFDDAQGNAICYITTDTLPGVFVPGYLCGDTSLQSYLKGIMPTRISMLSPSIVTDNDETPILYYSVNNANIPVKVEIYNVLGEMVRTIKSTPSQAVGSYKLPIGARGLPSGSYLLRLTTPISSETANFVIRK